MHDRALADAEVMYVWEGQCLVCETWFAHPNRTTTLDNPAPHGAFCPVCKSMRRMAPGVVHFKPQEETFDED